ncbi:unnamed protein product [Trifolium pratense]|uniref:Uncharacterized protein n=1 Tax=Trifolium pratense TaxID=57577 RepID=A0ACB0LF12_TRIPR|nr:unnamed protein product [Trifolium pratense]
MGATSAKDAWGTLKEEFQGSDKVRAIKLQTLRREFELIKMKESETVKDYYTKIKELVSQMRSYGDNILDKRIVEKILISIPRKYDAIVTTIEQTKDLSTMSVTELIGSLEAYEQRLSRHDDNTFENAFQSKLKLRSHDDRRYGGKKNQDEYPPCGICKRTNHAEKYCRWCGKEQCQHCKKFGHVEKNCYSKNKHQANFVEEHECENDQHEYEQYLFYATQGSNDELSENWYLDSGCSNHMAKDESIFKDIDDSVKVKVRLGNGTVVESKGKGTVMVETNKGTRFIKDVLLVPNLKENLLSIGQMMEKGYILHFERDTCSIYDNSHKRHEIARVKMDKRNRSFPIIFKYTPIRQSDIEDMEHAIEELGTLPSPSQQEISSPESTPTRVKSPEDISETCNFSMLDSKSYQVASKQQLWTKDNQEKLPRLRKPLYGLKKAHREWYNRIDHCLIKRGFG